MTVTHAPTNIQYFISDSKNVFKGDQTQNTKVLCPQYLGKDKENLKVLNTAVYFS